MLASAKNVEVEEITVFGQFLIEGAPYAGQLLGIPPLNIENRLVLDVAAGIHIEGAI
jgi:hypothetical protein